jgi:hypothetical protein
VDDHPAYAGIDDGFSAIFQRRNLDTRQSLASLARHTALTIRHCVPPAARPSISINSWATPSTPILTSRGCSDA